MSTVDESGKSPVVSKGFAVGRPVCSNSRMATGVIQRTRRLLSKYGVAKPIGYGVGK